MMRIPVSRLFSTVAMAIGLLAANVAAASPYSGFYVFGDSLSDSGNIYATTSGSLPPSPYFNGRFSNGPTYAEDLAGRYGFAAAPSLLGGTNYAFGGATAGGAAMAIPSLGDQVSMFRAKPGAADSSALYVVWAGGNDLRADPSPVGIGSALGGISGAIQGLYQEGARNFLVMNLPNLGLTPEAQANGTVAAATAGSMIFNSYFNSTIGGLQGALAGSNIRTLDTFALLSGIVANPVAAGLGNVTNACFNGTSVCSNPDSYLFWDGIHPTAAGHRLIADAAFNVLAVPEPETYALMLAGMGLLALRMRRRHR